MMQWETVIGLEIHVQLATQSVALVCRSEFGGLFGHPDVRDDRSRLFGHTPKSFDLIVRKEAGPTTLEQEIADQNTTSNHLDGDTRSRWPEQ